jgi:hypothetical protein
VYQLGIQRIFAEVTDYNAAALSEGVGDERSVVLKLENDFARLLVLI